MDPVSQVFQGFTAYQLSAALKGAIELDLFSAIAEGNATAEALATRCQASTRGVRILCDYLAAVGFLHKTDGRYTLDPESGPLLDRRSPLYVGSAIRFRTVPGSAFTVDYGRDYDLVLLTNFLHHFDEEACVAVLRKVHAALRPGGRAVTVEMIPDENRVTPPEAATFALVMLAGTP